MHAQIEPNLFDEINEEKEELKDEERLTEEDIARVVSTGSNNQIAQNQGNVNVMQINTEESNAHESTPLIYVGMEYIQTVVVNNGKNV